MTPKTLPWVIRPADALPVGIHARTPSRRFQQGQWQRPYFATYLSFSGTPTFDQRVAGALGYAGDGAVLTGAAALRRHGVRTVREPARVAVLVPHGRRRRSRRGRDDIDVRQTTRMPAPPDWVDGVPVATVARAVVDECRPMIVVRAARAMVADVVQRGLCSVEALESELDSGPRRGSGLLRIVLAEVSSGAWSAPEIELAVLLTAAGVAGFVANAAVRAEEGTLLGVYDLVWAELQAVIEVDSREWHLSPDGWQNTLRRHALLEEHGWSVLHITPAQIRNQPDEIVRLVRSWLSRRSADLAR